MIRCKLLPCVLKVCDNTFNVSSHTFHVDVDTYKSELKCKLFLFIIHKKSWEILKQVLMSADDGTLSLFVKNSMTASLISLV